MSIEKSEQLKVMKYLSDCYPREKIPASTVRQYVAELSTLDPGILWPSVKKIIRTSRFFPTLAEIFSVAQELMDIDEPTAEEEWAWVVDAMFDCGAGREVEGHEIAEQAVAIMGGWNYLGMGQVSDRPWREKSFTKIYNQLRDRERGMALIEAHERDQIEAAQAQRIGGDMEKIDVASVVGKLRRANGG